MRLPVLALVPLTLTACGASVTAIPLDATGHDDHTVRGIRFYLPKPYILVTELPVSPTAPPAAALAAAPAPKAKGDTTDAKTTDAPQSSIPTAPATDTSFTAAMASYAVKLIYLPDYSHPMALREDSGLFGNVAMTPALQDGWMLTSLSSSNDSGGPAALAAVASLVGSAVGGVATGGASKVASATADKSKNGAELLNEEVRILGLPPGPGPAPGPAAPKPKTIVVTKTIYATQPNWGENVLPAGLYAFDFLPATSDPSPTDRQGKMLLPGAGRLIGLKPVVFFCAHGPERPTERPDPPPPAAGMFDLYETPCTHPNIDRGK